jgi:hypothetical protein
MICTCECEDRGVFGDLLPEADQELAELIEPEMAHLVHPAPSSPLRAPALCGRVLPASLMWVT